MRRAFAFAGALLSAALAARADPAAPKARTARQDFLAGVESHLKGDDDSAARDWPGSTSLTASFPPTGISRMAS
jgi:hypothetical protein